MTRIHCDCCGNRFDETNAVTVSGLRFCSDACCETHVDERCDCSMPDHWRIYDDMQPLLPLTEAPQLTASDDWWFGKGYTDPGAGIDER